MYAKKIKQKKFSWGASALATPFPSKGVVSIVGSVAGGERYFGNEEVAEIHAAMLMEGTYSRTKKEIQEFLDSIGASLSFSSCAERLTFSAKVQPKYLGVLLALIAECLREPSFPEPELAVMKMREAADLELEAESTGTQAHIVLSRMLFRPGHPNYAETTKESELALKNITGFSLKKSHAKLIDRSSLIISLAGDIAPQKVFALVGAEFKSLPKNTLRFKSFAKAVLGKAEEKQIEIANKASIDYYLGIATGIHNTAKEYPALVLATQIFGNRGGFTGRLMKTVREAEGLTYGVYALSAGTRAHTDGYFYIWATFAPQLFEKGKESIKRQLQLIIDEGVTEHEVARHAMQYDAKSKVQLSNSGAYARAAHDLLVDGKELSYLDEFPKKMLKLTKKDVDAAIQKFWKMDNMSSSAAGTFEAF